MCTDNMHTNKPIYQFDKDMISTLFTRKERLMLQYPDGSAIMTRLISVERDLISWIRFDGDGARYYPVDFIGSPRMSVYIIKKEDSKMSNSINIDNIKGVKPATRYEFDPEYFYKLCAFTVIDLRTDPVTRYECILIETNPTYLVFAAFDSEKEYSSKGAFNNIKRLTVNMDRYLAGEFQMIRHGWEG
jgi:hypothetical protein